MYGYLMAQNSDGVTKTLANRLFQSFSEENCTCHEFTMAHIDVKELEAWPPDFITLILHKN